MTWPLQFPDPLEEARERGLEFQRLAPTDRWNEMAALMAFGWATVRSSPHRETIVCHMDEQEQRWREIQTELFARYGR